MRKSEELYIVFKHGKKYHFQQKGSPVGAIYVTDKGIGWSLCHKGDVFDENVAKIMAIYKNFNTKPPQSLEKLHRMVVNSWEYVAGKIHRTKEDRTFTFFAKNVERTAETRRVPHWDSMIMHEMVVSESLLFSNIIEQKEAGACVKVTVEFL